METSSPANTEINNDYTCSICLDKCSSSDKLLCGHFVHTQCIAEWASSNRMNSNSCPMCRTTYKESRKIYKLKNNASTKIQAHWRRYVKQRKFLALRKASIKIQAHWRRYHTQILYIESLINNSIEKNQGLCKRTYGSFRRYTRFRFNRDFEKMFKRNNYNSYKRILKKAGKPKHRFGDFQTSQELSNNDYYCTSNVNKFVDEEIYVDEEIKAFNPPFEIPRFVFKKRKWQCFKPHMPISSRE